MECSMRFIASADLKTVMPLLYEYFPEFSQEEVLRRIKSCLKEDYKIVAMFPNDKKEAVAILGMSYATKMYTGEALELHHLYVTPDYRGQGLAKHLFRAADNYARMRDLKIVMLDSYLELKDAHKLYEKLGYKSIGYHFVKEL